MQTIFLYPKEYLGEAYIHPRTFRKFEIAKLLDRSWDEIRKEINNDEDLQSLLVRFHYRTMQKSLFSTQVAILFAYFGPPLATAENVALVRQVAAIAKLSKAG